MILSHIRTRTPLSRYPQAAAPSAQASPHRTRPRHPSSPPGPSFVLFFAHANFLFGSARPHTDSKPSFRSRFDSSGICRRGLVCTVHTVCVWRRWTRRASLCDDVMMVIDNCGLDSSLKLMGLRNGSGRSFGEYRWKFSRFWVEEMARIHIQELFELAVVRWRGARLDLRKS